MIFLHSAALIVAIGITPWLLARMLDRQADTATTLALWGPIMIGLNSVVMIAIHLAGLPLSPDSLALAHLIISTAVIGASRLSGVAAHFPDTPAPRRLAGCAILFAVLVIPVSHIAGVDTYKWQDLAGSVAVEGRIAWLIHPISLLGFTPRSYPSAQPLLLATIQMLGHTGVDWGFYILSVTLGLTGLFGAWRLGRHLFISERTALWFAFLYVFSPVFMRYNYWATGRGMVLALLPIYLLVLLRCPVPFKNKTGHAMNLLSWLPAFLGLSLLLALSHKAGLIGALLIPVVVLFSPLLALARSRFALCVLLLLATGAGFMIADNSPVTLITRLVTRFAWLAPLAALGVCGAPDRFQSPGARAMLAGGLATVILSCTPDMYGALLALPFVAYAAVCGFTVWESENPLPRIKPASSLFAMTLLASLAILINQAMDSPSHSLYRAALFLERYDPKGPFRIEAPGRARTQMQAYVSGCPRFTVEAGDTATMGLRPPPGWSGHPQRDARSWIDYLRVMLELRGASADWYGGGTKVYVFTVDGKGTIPPKGKLLFKDGSVELYERP